jgi:hypothetical protein
MAKDSLNRVEMWGRSPEFQWGCPLSNLILFTPSLNPVSQAFTSSGPESARYLAKHD